MMDLPDPGGLEQYAKATAAILDVVKKLWHAVPRRKPTSHAGGAMSRVDAVDEQIATLNNALGEVLRLMMQAQENEEKAINALFESVKAHQRLLTALAQGQGVGVPKQKRRRGPKKKRRRK